MRTESSRISAGLLCLRLSVFLVMLMWSLDKFLNPVHTARVFNAFYFISDLPHMGSYLIGTFQIVVVICFGLGIQKKMSYGLVFFMHLVSTLSSYQKYLAPWEGVNLLFFAAFPMLAAIYTLYVLRELDTRTLF